MIGNAFDASANEPKQPIGGQVLTAPRGSLAGRGRQDHGDSFRPRHRVTSLLALHGTQEWQETEHLFSSKHYESTLRRTPISWGFFTGRELLVGYEEGEDFEDALETLRSGHYEAAAHLLRAFIKRFPYHIDSYHHLGIIETDLGHRVRGLKYFEMGYRIGLRSVPEDFSGRLPWIHLENRPFLRAAHGYGLALERERRHLEAVDVYEHILALNPDDNQGIRYLLPS